MMTGQPWDKEGVSYAVKFVRTTDEADHEQTIEWSGYVLLHELLLELAKEAERAGWLEPGHVT